MDKVASTLHAFKASRRVALIGFGALGQAVASELSAGRIPGFTFQGALVQPGRQHSALPYAWDCVEEMLAARPDIVVEAAGHSALASHASACLSAGHDVVVASVGALLDQTLFARLSAAASDGGSRLLVPSGALGGLDYLRAASRMGPVDVRYRGSKPVAAWKGTHAEGLLDLRTVRKPIVFFRGQAQEAARLFPQNANVVAALALAVGDPARVSVELIADPVALRNSHEIDAQGAAGCIRLSVENEPMPENPKSSRITAFSLLETLAGGFAERDP